MLNRIIAFSLTNRALILAVTVLVIVAGVYAAGTLPIDVFPDLNRPTVTVMTEAPGLAPQEVEEQVTRKLEYALNGATGVRRVRSASGIGLSIVWVEFDWGSDIYQDRQVVAEKLQLVELPKDARATMAPIASIMGEIMLIGLRSQDRNPDPLQQAMELRTWAEFTLSNRLRSVEGVAQVTVIGGIHKQYQVVTSPGRLAAQNVSLGQLVEAVENATGIAGGGILEQSTTEKLIRINARSLTPQDIEDSTVVFREPRAILVKDVADVRFAGPVPRGAAGIVTRDDGRAPLAVILTVQKQPHADTVRVTRALEAVLDDFRGEVPAGAVLETQIFKQADFIEAAVRNVEEAIRDGAIWVFLILFLFLWNLRTSIITLIAIPLSILITALVFRLLGVSLNTMTLGGIAVAVGELVDDAIVDVENIYRRLREKGSGVVSTADAGAVDVPSVEKTPDPFLPFLRPPLTTIFEASSEVRNSIVYATLIVCLVVLPLFALSGLEGRMFAPLALGYLVSLAASLVVSLTVTPVLASFLLPGARFMHRTGDPFLLRWLKKLDAPVVRFALRRPRAVLGTVAVLAVLAVLSILGMGGEFLPPFQEGTLTINVTAEPGTSLAESERLGRRVEDLLLRVPEVLSVARRTGRAENDEHAEGVNSSELDVRLMEHQRPKPGPFFAAVRAVPGLYGLGSDTLGRPRSEVLADIRNQVARLPGVRINIGQPIAHRLDHVLSGVRAQIAVKVFGPDDPVALEVMRNTAADIEQQLRSIPGVVDLQVEPQVGIPQVRLEVRRDQAQYYGLKPGEVARLLETAYRGKTVAEIIDGDRRFDLVVWYDEASRNDLDVIRSTVLETPSGKKVALNQVVRVVDTRGPNTLNRESVQRRLVVSCNVQGRDLASVVADIQRKVQPIEEKLRQTAAQRPAGAGYRIEYGGQFQAQQEANRRLLVFGLLALAGVFLLLCRALESWQLALQVLLVNIPLAAIGSVIALLLVNRPGWSELSAAPFWTWPSVWLRETNLSVAHWIGFITLIGIVCRNGILMISHYQHLMRHEGEGFTEQMIVRGSLERLAPVLMTAGVAIMGLVPLALGAGQTGKEILQPLAVVVIGGLLVSALLDQIVTPATFYLFGGNVGHVANARSEMPAKSP